MLSNEQKQTMLEAFKENLEQPDVGWASWILGTKDAISTGFEGAGRGLLVAATMAIVDFALINPKAVKDFDSLLNDICKLVNMRCKEELKSRLEGKELQ